MAAGQVRLVHRHYPFLAPESVLAAEASECAADQGRFWPYREGLFALQPQGRSAMAPEGLKRLAADLGLDRATFGACLDGHAQLQRVLAERAAAERIGVNATPTIFVQGRRVSGVPDYPGLQGIMRSVQGR